MPVTVPVTVDWSAANVPVMVPKVEAVDVMIASGMDLGGDGFDYVDAEDFGAADGRAREDELDIPPSKAEVPVGRIADVGHREAETVAGLRDRHRVRAPAFIFKGRGERGR